MPTFDKSTLPAPPAFPASNASYNSIVGKMHKAALGAASAEAAIMAVKSINDHIKGVNTYAKATRRYADQLIHELMAEDVGLAKAPAKGKKAKADKPAIPLTDKTPEPKAKAKKAPAHAKLPKKVKA